MGWKKRKLERLLDERDGGPSPQALQQALVQLASQVRALSEKVGALEERIEKAEKRRAVDLVAGSDGRLALKAIKEFEARLSNAGIPELDPKEAAE